MDYSLISAAAAAISAARDIGKSAAGVHDFNQMATAVAQLNAEILKAQDSLFTHQGQLLAMQQELFGLKDALRQKEAALAQAHQEIAQLKQKKLELEQYERFRHAGGGWAYRRKDTTTDDMDTPTYCASCFENDKLALMQPGTGQDRSCLVCSCGFRMRR